MSTIASEPLRRRHIRYRYRLTDWEIRIARTTGFIGAVKGPLFVRDGRLFVSSESQLQEYFKRRKEWERKFLDSSRMTNYIKSPHAGKKTEINPDARRIAKRMPYRSIVPPPHYRFISCNNQQYWHIDDLNLFVRFITAAQNHALQQDGHPLYDPIEMVWSPRYPSPPDFSERYTKETRAWIEERHGNIT